MNFKVVAEANITQSQFGDLCGVSRVTVCTWVKGRWSPNKYVSQHVKSTLTAISDALASGRLPLPHDTPAPQRDAAIRLALGMSAQTN